MISTFSSLSQKNRRELIGETSALMGVDPVVVEKDIWVSKTGNLLDRTQLNQYSIDIWMYSYEKQCGICSGPPS